MTIHLCSECAVGSYDGQVELVPPPRLAREDGRGICVDACLALEITKLWAAGITTTGCCCGHGSHHAYIGVIDADIEKMKAMAYVVQPNETRTGAEDSFVPHTPLRAIPRGGVKVTDEGIAKAMTAFATQVREQDPNWEYENGEEGEPLLASPDGDYFALEYPLRAAFAALSAIEQEQEPVALQERVADWMIECFGEEISKDQTERADRFVEEALELAQAIGWTADRGHALVDYVFGRPVGEIGQEVGGVMVTLSALCNVFGVNIEAEAKREVDRITQPEIVLKIRAKQKAKPTGSALPIALSPSVCEGKVTEEMVERAAIGMWHAELDDLSPAASRMRHAADWSEEGEGVKSKWRRHARAALTAALQEGA